MFTQEQIDKLKEALTSLASLQEFVNDKADCIYTSVDNCGDFISSANNDLETIGETTLDDLEEAVTTIVSTLQDAASEISGSPDDIEKESERIIERIDEVKQIIVNVVEEVEKGEVIKIHKPKALAGLEELKRLLKLFGFTTTYKRIESSKGDYFGLIVHPEGIEINNMEELGEFVVNYLCKRLVVL